MEDSTHTLHILQRDIKDSTHKLKGLLQTTEINKGLQKHRSGYFRENWQNGLLQTTERNKGLYIPRRDYYRQQREIKDSTYLEGTTIDYRGKLRTLHIQKGLLQTTERNEGLFIPIRDQNGQLREINSTIWSSRRCPDLYYYLLSKLLPPFTSYLY